MPDQPVHPASKPAAKASAKPASKPAAKPSTQKAAFAASKADPALLAKVEAVMSDFAVYPRKMFGVTAWFVEPNAQMLGCVWGDGLNLRVGAQDAAALIASGRATPFDPMGGRPMREYVLVPASTLGPAALRKWIARGVAFTSALPRKKGK